MRTRNKFINTLQRKISEYKQLFFCFALLVFPLYLQAQKPKDFAYLHDKYPNDGMVMPLNQEILHIELQNDSLVLWSEYRQEKYFLSNNSAGLADFYISYNSFMSVSDNNIEAWYYHPDGPKKYLKQAINTIQTTDDFSSVSFFDDGKSKRVFSPKTSQGDYITLNYQRHYNEARFLSPFYFGGYWPIEKCQYIVEFPDDIEIGYKVFNDSLHTIKLQKHKKADKLNVYEWSAENIPARNYSYNDFSPAYYAPHVAFYIKKVHKKQKTENYLGSTDDLYNWYYTKIKSNTWTKGKGVLGHLVDSLTHNQKQAQEKVRIIYNWMLEHIRYVAFEAGQEGFVPEQPESVYSKRYGDCKGMSSLLCALLTEAGISAHLAWIGTRDIPYTYEELPLPMIDNHMIVVYEIDGKKYVLDATCDKCTLEHTSDFILGKEALYSIDSSTYGLFTVPVPPIESNTIEDSISLRIENEKLKGEGFIALKGYSRLNLSMRLGQAQLQIKSFFTDLLECGNNKFVLETYQIKGLGSNDSTLSIHYTFSLPDYIQSYANETYVNLHLKKNMNNDLMDTTKFPFDRQIKYPQISKYVLNLNIPTHYKLKKLPESANYSNPKFGFEMNFESTNKSVILRKTFKLNTLSISRTDFAAWNEMVQLLMNSYKKTLTLTK